MRPTWLAAALASSCIAATAVADQHVRTLTPLGATSMSAASNLAAADGPFAPASEIKQDPNAVLPRNPFTPGTPGLTNPVAGGNPVAGNGVTRSNPGFFGFNGLDHVDQRTANGGKQFSLEPPDQALCAGNGFVVEGVNDVLRVYDTRGRAKTAVQDFNTFFHLPAEIDRAAGVYGPFLSDPKCYYDLETRRWFITILEIETDPKTGAFGTHASTLLAVSDDDEPTGSWFTYSIDMTDDGTNGTPKHASCPCFGDQPLIGADANGFYITTNEFAITGPGFNGAQVFALSKRALVEGGLPKVVHIDNLTLAEGQAYSIQPATSPRGQFDRRNHGTEYFLSALDFSGTLDNRVAVWSMTNTRSLGHPSPDVKLSYALITTETYGQPPNADQKPGPTPLRDCLATDCLHSGTTSVETLEQIATNDDRMNQVVYARGQLWSGVNTIVTVGNQTRAGIAYFVVDPDWTARGLQASVDAQGYLAVANANIMYPSIGVNTRGEGVMTFSLTGPDFFPSAAYAVLEQHEDEAPAVHIAGVGLGPEDGLSGYVAYGGAGVARWGDYSAAVADGDAIWMSSEYIPASCTSLTCSGRTTLGNWGTFISRVVP